MVGLHKYEKYFNFGWVEAGNVRIFSHFTLKVPVNLKRKYIVHLFDYFIDNVYFLVDLENQTEKGLWITVFP